MLPTGPQPSPRARAQRLPRVCLSFFPLLPFENRESQTLLRRQTCAPLCVRACVLSLQSCPTLCDPRDCSPPGSSALCPEAKPTRKKRTPNPPGSRSHLKRGGVLQSLQPVLSPLPRLLEPAPLWLRPLKGHRLFWGFEGGDQELPGSQQNILGWTVCGSGL